METKKLEQKLVKLENALKVKCNKIERLEVRQKKLDAKFDANNHRYSCYIDGVYLSGRPIQHYSAFYRTINSIVLNRYTYEYDDRQLERERKVLKSEMKNLENQIMEIDFELNKNIGK